MNTTIPLCFRSLGDWQGYQDAARYTPVTASLGICEDCTPAYEAQMVAAGRCEKAKHSADAERAEAEAYADAVDRRLEAEEAKARHAAEERARIDAKKARGPLSGTQRARISRQRAKEARA